MISRKLFKGTVSLILAAALILPLGQSNFNALSTVYADDYEDAKKAKEEAEAKKAEAEAKLTELNKSAADTQSAIEELDSEIGEYSSKILELTEEQNKLQTQISITELKLQNAHILETNQYASMKKRIAYAYENGDVDYIEALMAIEDFSTMINQSEYVDKVSSYDQNQLNKLVSIKQSIADEEEKMQEKLQEIKDVKAENEAQQGALQVLQDGKKEKLAEYNGLIVDTNTQISELDEDIETKRAEIASIEAEMEAKRQAALEAARQAQESQSSSEDGSSDEGSSDSGSSYVPVISGNGVIGVWPSQSTWISSYYGPRDTGIYGASTYHRGIDIGASYGSCIYASGDGYVARACYSSIRGNYIIISHGGGICTLYQHMSGFAVSEGDNVSAGQVVGYVGETGVASGPHLHFEVWIDECEVDPLGYVSY